MTADGQLIDMRMAAKDWCIIDSEICQTDCKLISRTAE